MLDLVKRGMQSVSARRGARTPLALLSWSSEMRFLRPYINTVRDAALEIALYAIEIR